MNVNKYIVNNLGEIVETVSFNEETNEIYLYDLKDDETLILKDLNGIFLKPQWNFKNQEWVEKATDEELQQYQRQLERQKEIQKTDEDKQKEAIDLLGKQVAMLRIQLMRGGVK